MEQESLADYLRRQTRNFTAPLPEEAVFSLGLALARELALAHADRPPRFPSLDPSDVLMVDAHPKLGAGAPQGEVAKDLFDLGSLLISLATATPPELAWRLDGPPVPPLSNLTRRGTLAALVSLTRSEGFATAEEVTRALEGALAAPADPRLVVGVFRGDAGRTGQAPGMPAAAQKLSLTWVKRLGVVRATPALTEQMVVALTLTGRVLWLDRTSGRLWHELSLGAASEASPAVSERRLFVATDQGQLIALDLLEARELYRVQVGTMVRSSPLVCQGKLIAGVLEGKAGGGAVALQADTGKVLWKRRLGGPVFSSPALAAERILIGCDDGQLYCLAIESGEIVWTRPMSSKVRATPSVTGETAVVGDFGGRITALNVTDGSPRWTAELGHPLYSSAAVSGSLCSVGCHDGHVHAFALETGAALFQFQTGGPVVASPTAWADRLLVGSTDGSLYLLDHAGQLIQAVALSSQGIQATACAANGLVLAGSEEGLHALSLTT